jgi:hypothetical protein
LYAFIPTEKRSLSVGVSANKVVLANYIADVRRRRERGRVSE